MTELRSAYARKRLEEQEAEEDIRKLNAYYTGRENVTRIYGDEYEAALDDPPEEDAPPPEPLERKRFPDLPEAATSAVLVKALDDTHIRLLPAEEVSADEKLLLGHILSFLRRDTTKDDIYFMSNVKTAKQYGWHRDRVGRMLNKLERENYIEHARTKRSGVKVWRLLPKAAPNTYNFFLAKNQKNRDPW